MITLAIILVLGGLTLLLQDKRFFMWKPTAVNWLFAVAFLKSEFIGKKPLIQCMMDHAIGQGFYLTRHIIEPTNTRRNRRCCTLF